VPTDQPWVIVTGVAGIIGFLITLLTAVILGYEWSRSRRLDDYRRIVGARRLKRRGARGACPYPLRLYRRLKYSDYRRVLYGFSRYYAEVDHFRPAAIIGIHVGGIAVAAELARSAGQYCPIHMIELKRNNPDEPPAQNQVFPKFDPETFRDQQVLVVDNSIRSGKTLQTVTELLKEHGVIFRTCIAYRESELDGEWMEPDYVIMESWRRKRMQGWLR